jgi:hypothetical protein
MTRKNKLLNIRILMPSPKLDEEVILKLTSNINSNISIKYFDGHLSSDTITSILDSEYMYILGFDLNSSSSSTLSLLFVSKNMLLNNGNIVCLLYSCLHF